MFRTIILAGTAVLALAPPAHAQQITTEFQQGLADREAWESWFNGLTSGEYRSGAYFWSGQRSLPNPTPCTSLGGEATMGCFAAKARLDVSDYRRRVAPAYRQGWNSLTGPATQPAAAPPAPPPASTVAAPATPALAAPAPKPYYNPTVSPEQWQQTEPAPLPTPLQKPTRVQPQQQSWSTVGHNGAWEISAGGGVCMMRTSTANGDYGLTILKMAGDSRAGALIYSKMGDLAAHLTGSLTDAGSGELIFVKSFEQVEQMPGAVGATLSTSDLIQLWSNTLMDFNSARLATVKVGNVMFQVDIHGANEAFQNVSSCASDRD